MCSIAPDWEQPVKLDSTRSQYIFCLVLSFTGAHSGAQIQINADKYMGCHQSTAIGNYIHGIYPTSDNRVRNSISGIIRKQCRLIYKIIYKYQSHFHTKFFLFWTITPHRIVIILHWSWLQNMILFTQNTPKGNPTSTDNFADILYRKSSHRKCQDYVYIKWEYWSTM